MSVQTCDALAHRHVVRPTRRGHEYPVYTPPGQTAFAGHARCTGSRPHCARHPRDRTKRRPMSTGSIKPSGQGNAIAGVYALRDGNRNLFRFAQLKERERCFCQGRLLFSQDCPAYVAGRQKNVPQPTLRITCKSKEKPPAAGEAAGGSPPHPIARSGSLMTAHRIPFISCRAHARQSKSCSGSPAGGWLKSTPWIAPSCSRFHLSYGWLDVAKIW
jgi:hypothetical protein